MVLYFYRLFSAKQQGKKRTRKGSNENGTTRKEEKEKANVEYKINMIKRRDTLEKGRYLEWRGRWKKGRSQ